MTSTHNEDEILAKRSSKTMIRSTKVRYRQGGGGRTIRGVRHTVLLVIGRVDYMCLADGVFVMFLTVTIGDNGQKPHLNDPHNED